MKNFFKSLISEGENEISAVRVMALLSLVTGVVIGGVGVYLSKDLGGVAQICGIFVGAAFAGKTASKFAERD
jgi:hypothetical protein